MLLAGNLLSRSLKLVCGLTLLASAAWSADGASPADIVPGSEVEVRTGDLWSRGTVVTKEGRTVLVRFSDVRQQWVQTSQVRVPGTGNSASTRPATSPASPGTKDGRVPLPGTRVECKWRGRWEPGAMVKSANGWYLLKLDSGRVAYMWVEPWAVRTAGSTSDIDSQGTRNDLCKITTPPPRNPPEPLTTPVAEQPVVAKEPTLRVRTPEPFVELPVTPLDLQSGRQPATGGKPVSLSLPATRPTPDSVRPISLQFQEVFVSTYARPSVVLCPDTPSIAVVAAPEASPGILEIVRFDIATGQQLGLHRVSVQGEELIAAADSGKVLLTSNSQSARLHLWQLDDDAYSRKATYGSLAARDGKAAFTYGRLLDSGRAVFATEEGMVYLVDLKSNRVSGFVQGASHAEPYVDPTGQILCVAVPQAKGRGTARLIRLSDWSVMAEFPASGSGLTAVDPTGGYIALKADLNTYSIVRVADGSCVSSLTPDCVVRRLDLMAPDTLLVDGFVVFDTNLGIRWWRYDPNGGAGAQCRLPSGQMLYVVSVQGDQKHLVAWIFTLPHAAATKKLKSASPDDFVVYPGAPVSISGDFAACGADKDKARQILRDRLQAAGLQVQETDQTLRLVFQLTDGPSRQETLRLVLGGRPGAASQPETQTVNCPSRTLTLTLTYAGTPIWSTQREWSFSPGSLVNLPPGQTLQQLADDAAKVRVDDFAGIVFPARIIKGSTPASSALLGMTNVTSNGPVSTPR